MFYVYPPQSTYEPVKNILKNKMEVDTQKEFIISSPLHEKRVLLLLVKKQMIGRRAYSDITKVKPSNREIQLYEKQTFKQNKTAEVN